MALPNKYEDPEKYKGRVKFVNLDPALQDMIKNSGTSSYNDTELKQSITNLNAKFNQHIKDYEKLNTKVDDTRTDLIDNYRNNSVDITYNNLDADLKNRIDHPGSGTGGEVDSDEFNRLAAQVTDLKTKVATNTNNITNNTNNLSTLNQSYNQFKNDTTNTDNTQNHNIADNTRRIDTIEDTLQNGLSIDVNKLSPELQTIINKVNPMETDLNSLNTKVNTNINDIALNRTDIDSLKSNVTSFENSTTTNLNNINGALTSHTNSLATLNDNINALNIDTIIKQGANTEDVDAGKITKSHLSSDLSNQIDKVIEAGEDLTDLKDTVENFGSTIFGDSGLFVYKNDTHLTAREILSQIYVADTLSILSQYQLKYYSPIYCKEDNQMYFYVGSDNDTSTVATEVNPDDWSITQEPLTKINYNFILWFDPENNSLYYNSNGTLLLLFGGNNPNGIKINNWSLKSLPDDSFQISHQDNPIMSLTDDTDTSTESESNTAANMLLSASLFARAKKQNTSQNIILPPDRSVDIQLDETQLYNLKILLLDQQPDSSTYNFYIDSPNSFTVAYLPNGIRVLNNKNTEDISLKIMY